MNTNNNFFGKHDINTEGDHPEPNISNLVNQNLTLDQIREKSNKNDSEKSNDLIKNEEHLKTTETDYKFEYFANNMKMVPDSEVKLFEKNYYRDNNKSERYSPHENIDSYHKTEDDIYKNNDVGDNYATPKPSQFGPSYGSGTSAPQGGGNFSKNEFESEEEENLAKLDMLRKLGELTQYGIKLSQPYNMNSSYKAMKYEYELHRSIRDKQNGVKWLSNMMLNACYGLELANEKFNPFDFHLKGWSEQMSEDVGDYYDVFGELYEKYFKTGKPVPPELKLFFMISGSAIKFHLANVAMNSLPNLGNMMNSNPVLAERLRQQAASDKIRQQNMKQRNAINTAGNKEHETANQKASDIQMLREKHQEYMQMQQQQQAMMQQQMMQQQLLERQQQLNDLEIRLNAQISENRSAYSNPRRTEQKTMMPPNLPPNFRDMLSQTNRLPFNSTNQELYRQQQILEQKKRMKNMETSKIQNVNINDKESTVKINPNIDQIIDSKLNDDFSKIDEISTLDHSDIDDTENSRVKIRRRRTRKRNNLKVNTN